MEKNDCQRSTIRVQSEEYRVKSNNSPPGELPSAEMQEQARDSWPAARDRGPSGPLHPRPIKGRYELAVG